MHVMAKAFSWKRCEAAACGSAGLLQTASKAGRCINVTCGCLLLCSVLCMWLEPAVSVYVRISSAKHVNFNAGIVEFLLTQIDTGDRLC